MASPRVPSTGIAYHGQEEGIQTVYVQQKPSFETFKWEANWAYQSNPGSAVTSLISSCTFFIADCINHPMSISQSSCLSLIEILHGVGLFDCFQFNSVGDGKLCVCSALSACVRRLSVHVSDILGILYRMDSLSCPGK